MKKLNKKYAKPTIILCLVAILAIAGTVAYLTDVTEEVTNEFTPGEDIDIYITETNQKYTIVPNETEAKDPTVHVDADSADAYVFVTVTEEILTAALSDGTYTFQSYVAYGLTSDWVLVSKSSESKTSTGYTTTTYIYAYATDLENLTTVVKNADDITSLQILVGSDENNTGEVSYPITVTQAMIALLNDTNPTLSFQAYAIQTANITDESGNDATFAAYVYSLIDDTVYGTDGGTDGTITTD